MRYGPLFLYVIALLTDLWDDPRVIVPLYNPFRTDFIRDGAISQRGDMGRAHHKTSVDPLRILPTFNSNQALPQTDEVYAEDGALIAIANKWVDSDQACRAMP